LVEVQADVKVEDEVEVKFEVQLEIERTQGQLQEPQVLVVEWQS